MYHFIINLEALILLFLSSLEINETFKFYFRPKDCSDLVELNCEGHEASLLDCPKSKSPSICTQLLRVKCPTIE